MAATSLAPPHHATPWQHGAGAPPGFGPTAPVFSAPPHHSPAGFTGAGFDQSMMTAHPGMAPPMWGGYAPPMHAQYPPTAYGYPAHPHMQHHMQQMRGIPMQQQMQLQAPSLLKAHPPSPPLSPPSPPCEAFPGLPHQQLTPRSRSGGFSSESPASQHDGNNTDNTHIQPHEHQHYNTLNNNNPTSHNQTHNNNQTAPRRAAIYHPAVGTDPFAGAEAELADVGNNPPPPGLSRRRASTSPAAVTPPGTAGGAYRPPLSRKRVSSLQNLADAADALGLPDSYSSGSRRRQYSFGPTAERHGGHGGTAMRVRTHSLTIQIPMASVGSIMGPSGSIMKRLRADSGALIVLQQKDQMVPGQRRRGVTISGTEEEVLRAKEMVAACIAADAVSDRHTSRSGSGSGLGLLAGGAGSGGRPTLMRASSSPTLMRQSSRSSPVPLVRQLSRSRLSLKPRTNEKEAGVVMAKGPDGTLGFHSGRSRKPSTPDAAAEPREARTDDAPAAPVTSEPKFAPLQRTWSCGTLDWSFNTKTSG